MFHSSILRRMECARNACSAHHISINDSVEIYVVFYQGLHSAVHQCVVFKTTNVLCKPTLSSICYMCRPDRQPALSVDFIVPAVLVVRFWWCNFAEDYQIVHTKRRSDGDRRQQRRPVDSSECQRRHTILSLMKIAGSGNHRRIASSSPSNRSCVSSIAVESTPLNILLPLQCIESPLASIGHDRGWTAHALQISACVYALHSLWIWRPTCSAKQMQKYSMPTTRHIIRFPSPFPMHVIWEEKCSVFRNLCCSSSEYRHRP